MDEKKPQLDELENTNAKLRASLKQCRDMVADYRAKLAANRNGPLLGAEPILDGPEQGG